MRRKSLGWSWAAALLALFVSSCSTFYEARFVPAPLEVRVEHADTPGLTARVLATVRGVRRADSEHPAAQFEVALRFENVGREPFEIDAGSFELVTADLRVLGPGKLDASALASLAPGASQPLEVVFPLPAGVGYRDLDLSGVVVRWALRSRDTRVVASASFERRASPNDSVYFYGGPVWYRPGWRSYSHVGAFCAY